MKTTDGTDFHGWIGTRIAECAPNGHERQVKGLSGILLPKHCPHDVPLEELPHSCGSSEWKRRGKPEGPRICAPCAATTKVSWLHIQLSAGGIVLIFNVTLTRLPNGGREFSPGMSAAIPWDHGSQTSMHPNGLPERGGGL